MAKHTVSLTEQRNAAPEMRFIVDLTIWQGKNGVSFPKHASDNYNSARIIAGDLVKQYCADYEECISNKPRKTVPWR